MRSRISFTLCRTTLGRLPEVRRRRDSVTITGRPADCGPVRVPRVRISWTTSGWCLAPLMLVSVRWLAVRAAAGRAACRTRECGLRSGRSPAPVPRVTIRTRRTAGPVRSTDGRHHRTGCGPSLSASGRRVSCTVRSARWTASSRDSWNWPAAGRMTSLDDDTSNSPRFPMTSTSKRNWWLLDRDAAVCSDGQYDGADVGLLGVESRDVCVSSELLVLNDDDVTS